MSEQWGNDEITEALDELISSLGVKEDADIHSLENLFRKGHLQQCVQEIATQLRLPNRINLSYVDAFSSVAGAETGKVEPQNTAAQVLVPENIPAFGTSSFEEFTIQVQIREDCRTYLHTFVTIVAHELSHILLASLRSPHMDSELYADLAPLVLGFRQIVQTGRTTRGSMEGSSDTGTRTIIYGYLTDAQFDLAYNHVTLALKGFLCDKDDLMRLVRLTQEKMTNALEGLATCREYLGHLGNHPPKKMKKEHGERVVQLHGLDYSRDWENQIETASESVRAAETFARELEHYTASAVRDLRAHARALKLASSLLDQVIEAITWDEVIMRKYVGRVYRPRKRYGGPKGKKSASGPTDRGVTGPVRNRRIERLLPAATIVLVTLLGINHFVRVSNGISDSSWGIVEHVILGRSAWSVLGRPFRSSELNHWLDALESSASLASSLSTYGSLLAIAPGLDAERKKAARFARTAYEHAWAISVSYLATIDPTLPKQYKGHFLVGMRLCAEGLEQADRDRLEEGMEHYDIFSAWLRSRRNERPRRE